MSGDLIGSLHEKGAVIFRQGDRGHEMFIVQSGSVEVSRTQGAQEIVLTVLEKGAFFGEMALFGPEERSATVRAVQATRLLSLTRDSLLERIRRDPGVSLHLIEELTRRLRRVNRQLRNIVYGDDDPEGPEPVTGPALDQAETVVPAEEPQAMLPVPEMEATGEPAPEEIAEVWRGAAPSTLVVEAGATIYREDEPCEAMYVILSGEVEIRRPGKRTMTTRFKPGAFFGESALLSNDVHSATAVAVTACELIPIGRQAFLDRIRTQPALAHRLIESMVLRLHEKTHALENPGTELDAVRLSVLPTLREARRITIAMVSLSTCGGCSTMLLDTASLGDLMERADVVYCPMLMDAGELPECDLILVDGAVRLQEEEDLLVEARAKCRFLVAWGTCSAFGGIPAMANRFEAEDLLEEAYGQTSDAYAYYLSGAGGLSKRAYQNKEMALLRKAFKIDDFVRVDAYLPGCPPEPELVQALIRELSGEPVEESRRPIVCGECGRKVVPLQVEAVRMFPGTVDGSTCLASQGVFCLGVLTRGGCGGPCPRYGLPCWGCRGPARTAIKKMEGGSFAEAAVEVLSKRCKVPAEAIRENLKVFKRQCHAMFDFEHNLARRGSRLR